MEALRTCRECGLEAHTEEELELFTSNPKSKYKKANICKKCASTKIKEHPAYKERNRKLRAHYRYGVSLEEYEKCMATSKVCEHCDTSENLCYDHDHVTMKFRGVLCRCCNSSLGKLGDTKEDIERLLIYLNKGTL